mmetsp:Transcript_30907/g.36421  ORF Transcript_30907/g.36421 Transcript_30907/m.36421 type:complete len:84 (+) Transcript_30907:1259-1510(+)
MVPTLKEVYVKRMLPLLYEKVTGCPSDTTTVSEMDQDQNRDAPEETMDAEEDATVTATEGTITDTETRQLNYHLTLFAALPCS